MRGIAVLLVFIVHFVTLSEPWVQQDSSLGNALQYAHGAGHAGVDLFFVLSGYLIYGSLIRRDQSFSSFMARRIQRIYPVFLTVLGMYLILSFLFPNESKIPSEPVQASVYIASNALLLPGLFPIEPMITVAWSLSYEMFFYLMVPLLVGALSMRAWPWQARAIFIVAVSVLGLLSSAAFGGPVRMLMFLAGMLLYELLATQDIKVKAPLASAALLISIAAAPLASGPTAGEMRVALLFLGALIATLHVLDSSQRTWLVAAFEWSPLRWLGNMSYSYYLIHGLTLKAFFLLLTKVPGNHLLQGWPVLALLPLTFGLTLVPSTLLFLGVERPVSLKPARPTRLVRAT